MQSVEINTSFDNGRDDITVVFEEILRQLWAVIHCLRLVSMVIQITCMENKTQFKTHLGKQLSHCFTEECVISILLKLSKADLLVLIQAEYMYLAFLIALFSSGLISVSSKSAKEKYSLKSFYPLR